LDNHTDINEQELIQALKQGSHSAFDGIYQMYAKRLYAYSLQFTKSADEAEDIVQNVFIKLWTNRANIRQEETLRSLLFIMAKHFLINSYRSKLNNKTYKEYIIYLNKSSIDNISNKLEYDEFVKQFHKAMKKLSVTQQKVVALSRIKQLSNKEIAEELSLSEQTVKNQLSIGLKALRIKLYKLLILFILFFIN
jgi:RNA polymerase sigma-70 factor (ECF subfamily)